MSDTIILHNTTAASLALVEQDYGYILKVVIELERMKEYISLLLEARIQFSIRGIWDAFLCPLFPSFFLQYYIIFPKRAPGMDSIVCILSGCADDKKGQEPGPSSSFLLGDKANMYYSRMGTG